MGSATPAPGLPPVRIAKAVEGIRARVRQLGMRLLPPHVALVEMTGGFAVAQIIYAAARLGIADVLAAQPLTAAQVAGRIGADPTATYRLMRALAAQSIFRERRDGRFELTALAQPLRSDTPTSVRPLLLMLGHPRYLEQWARLAESVRSGKPSVDAVYGAPLFEALQQDSDVAQVFNDAMACVTAMYIPPILAAYDFSKAHTIVDVGGGNGQLLAQVLDSAPHSRGVLFELESPAAEARRLLQSAGVADRVDIVVGSFFDGVPTGGDLYVLKRVLHDWDDDRAEAILSAVCRAMGPSSKALIIDAVLPSDNTPHFGKLLDLDMLIFTGGRERTRADFVRILDRAGLRLQRIVPTVAPVSLVEAVRR